MGITNKRPPRKETVGAQYICFNQTTEDGKWTNQYEEEVERSATVKSVKVTDSSENTDVYGSGEVYDTDVANAAISVEVEALAFERETLARMRAAIVSESGLVLDGATTERPFFGYGKVVKYKNGKIRFEWFPKCKLTENSDEVATAEEKPSEQNETITINAYSFDEKGNKRVYVDSTMKKFPVGLTEEKFFKKPILNEEDLKAAIGME